MSALCAQDISIVYRGATINDGDTVNIVANSDWLVFTIGVQNNSNKPANLRTSCYAVEATGIEVASVCADLCAAGNVSPVYTVASGSTYEWLYIDFMLDEESTSQGLFIVRTYPDNLTGDTNEFYVNVTYDPNYVGIGNIGKHQMEVFPTIAHSTINVVCPEGEGQLSVVDMQGREVMHTQVTGSTQLRIADLPAGVYCIVLQSRGTITIRRIIKR